ncbi:MAG TPA: sulfatase-like hydrolase/transferase [Myxococcales bacterium]|jgi:hypothetical protein
MNALSQRPVHPLLFAALPVLSLMLANFDEVAWDVALGALALAEALGAATWMLVRAALVRERHRAALLATLLVLSLLSVSRARLLEEALLSYGGATTFRLAVTLWGLAVLLLALVLRRTRRDLRLATGAANFAGLAVVGLLCVRLAGAQGAARQGGWAGAPPGSRAEGAAPPAGEAAPSVYLLIPDAHGRHDLLSSNYGVDSTAFLAGLRARGFRIVEGSRSNYDRTSYSIPSLLGLDYLPAGYVPSIHSAPVVPAAARFLKDRGYVFVGVQTLPEVDLRLVDVLVRRPAWSGDFHDELFGAFLSLRQTWEERQRERIRFAFEALAQVAGTRPRQFVVAHVKAPHEPYVFLHDGSEAPAEPPSRRSESVRGYAEQVQYVDRLILEAIDVILAKERIPPVIVLVGDHGPWEYYAGDSNQGLNGSFLLDHFSNLVAVRLPKGGPDCLWDGMTLVNVLRSVLRCQFQAPLEPLPDRSFITSITSDEAPALDVTDQTGTPEDWARYARLHELDQASGAGR